MRDPVIIIGAGAGGLSAASHLAHSGLDVLVLEKEASEGGKMRQVRSDTAMIDAGPTVFTMRWVFEELFAKGGQAFASQLPLRPASVLARHVWPDMSQLDLHADPGESADAIGAFAGKGEADAYLGFVTECRQMYATLKDSFMAAQKPSPLSLMWRVGNPGALWRTRPFETYWSRISRRFRDPRLRQLFARYTTYVGSSPFQAPATLMLIAHVEQDGVWLLPDGMRSLAGAMRRLAEGGGAAFRFGAEVRTINVSAGRVTGVRLASGEEIAASAIVFNGDVSALGAGLLGRHIASARMRVRVQNRSLSAVTWCTLTRTRGLPLHYHNVLFGDDYPDEFEAVFRRRTISAAPTIYICAQDRLEESPVDRPERLLLLVNAPADGDSQTTGRQDSQMLSDRVEGQLARYGLTLSEPLHAARITGPDGFNHLFPASGGALYGRANHGPMASFARPGSATGIDGLYLAGGSVHPGPGVPMATISGRLAAERLLDDMKNRHRH